MYSDPLDYSSPFKVTQGAAQRALACYQLLKFD
jgi:hypothetical protein